MRQELDGPGDAMWRRWLLVSVASVLALAASPKAAVAQAKGPLRVGVFLPLSGPAAAGASANKLGYELATKEINAAGGVAGRPIELVYADDKGDPTAGVGEMKRLVSQERVEAVVGTNSSQVMVAALPALNDGKVLAISETASPLLTVEAGPYHFSMLPSAGALGRQMAEYVADVTKAKAPALLYDDAAATRTAVAEIRKVLADKSIALVAEQQYRLHPSDVSPQLLSLRRARPDALILYSASQDDVGAIQKNVGEVGWEIDQVSALTAAAGSNLVVKVAGPRAFDRTVAQAFRRFTYCKDEGDADVVDFIARVKRYAPDLGPQTDYFNIASGYDSVQVLARAVLGAGTTDGPALSAWLEANAHSLKTITAEHLSAGRANHFMVGEDALTMVTHPELRNGAGLQKRARC